MPAEIDTTGRVRPFPPEVPTAETLEPFPFRWNHLNDNKVRREKAIERETDRT